MSAKREQLLLKLGEGGLHDVAHGLDLREGPVQVLDALGLGLVLPLRLEREDLVEVELRVVHR